MGRLILRTSVVDEGVDGLVNGQNFVVTGTGFGAVGSPAPIIFDQGGSGTVASNYDGAWPNTTPASAGDQTQYRSPGYRSVSAPHAFVSNFIAGRAAGPSFSPVGGASVQISKLVTSSIQNNDVSYIRCYYRLDPSWAPGNNTEKRNHKWFAYNVTGAGPAETDNGNYNYIDIDQEVFLDVNDSFIHKYSPNGGSNDHPLEDPDANGNNNYWDASPTSPGMDWINLEVELKWQTNNTGYMRVWSDGTLVMDYLGPTAFAHYIGEAGYMCVGGYNGNYEDNGAGNFRYFSDVYVSHTATRLVLTNSSSMATATIIEPQICTSRTDTQIEFTANLGRLPSGTQVWGFVRTAAGAWVAVNETLVTS